MSINRYSIEFILNTKRVSAQEINNCLAEFADKIQVFPCAQGEFKITLEAQDPEIVFDTCAQFGRMSSVRVDECSS